MFKKRNVAPPARLTPPSRWEIRPHNIALATHPLSPRPCSPISDPSLKLQAPGLIGRVREEEEERSEEYEGAEEEKAEEEEEYEGEEDNNNI